MAVKIVTDSTSDLPKDMAQKLGVTVVPLYVHFGEESLKDGVDITREEFFKRIKSGGVFPKTSQPNVGDFLDVYKPLVEQGNEIVSIHISDKLSGTLNSARGAVAELPDAKIELVDTRLASLGAQLVVKAAAEAANEGKSLAEVAQTARDVAEKVDLYFVLDTLEYLQKGGRVGRAQALLGGLLSIKPILRMRDGEIHPHEKIRSRAKAIERLREIAKQGGPYDEIAFIHEGIPEEVGDLSKDLAALTQKSLITGQIGPCIGVHTGPGVVGFALRKA